MKKPRLGLRSGPSDKQPRPLLSISQKAFNYLWRRKQWGGSGAQPLASGADAASSPSKVQPIATAHQPINNSHAPVPLKSLPKGGVLARGLAQLREQDAAEGVHWECPVTPP